MSAGPGDGSRAVAIGGGHGLSRSLGALRRVVDHVTAVVTVADDGGSSGRLRRDLDVVAPGDLRMALAALAGDRGLADLLQYRFPRGELAGHSLGNLVLVALQDLAAGDMVDALDRACRFLDVPGRVLPCTDVPVTLHARTGDQEVSGQAAIGTTPRLDQVWLDPPSPPATAAAVAAIRQADLLVLGPGSLYTSLLPNLLVPGVARAVTASNAPVVLVANLREQPGETEGMSLIAHLDALAEHVPDLTIDVLIAHDGGEPAGGAPLHVDETALAGRVGRAVVRDLLDGQDGHDPVVLGRCLAELLGR
ncbi:gluconeogenesis factor YvcK family protein [Nitriliruptor alkaliphilus]|uniref:gluconeogenesis factor YvcK family protein n=1 Tax=Nitriliruptor alkaliphilus TaxID=427918 RepID=UPI0006984723|nr:gluconeogenesis factor YvcK family protein [Nitriliruptor alkaliphilus]